MIQVTVNKENFKFTYLPDYATFLLNNRLTEFVTVGIRFCREADLPLLKPLRKFSEEQLVALSMEGNRELLTAIASNGITEHIEKNSVKWIQNNLGIVDKDEITAKDLTLGFFLRRKIFSFFLDSYTKNVVLQKFIIAELDNFTSQEELISIDIFLQMQKEKIIALNNELIHRETLLLEAQELSGIGSYLTNLKDASKSFYTPQYKTILETDDNTTFEEFLSRIHSDDRQEMLSLYDKTQTIGGYFEIKYRYTVNGRNKLIWTKGVAVVEEGKLILIRGTIRNITSA